jgi:hypothetical protein
MHLLPALKQKKFAAEACAHDGARQAALPYPGFFRHILLVRQPPCLMIMERGCF